LDWLVNERQQDLVPQEVLDGYEQGFKQALVQLLGKVRDSVLREKFQAMLNCPIKDARGSAGRSPTTSSSPWCDMAFTAKPTSTMPLATSTRR